MNNSIALDAARASCTKYPLTPELWKRLDLDEYLRTYPEGDHLTLTEYANHVNVTNFICGIGQTCNAGQLCSSAMAPDWYILVAMQNWNQVMNILYSSISFGIGAVQALLPTMTTDLCPPRTSLPYVIACWLSMAGSISAAIPGMIFPGVGLWVWVFIQGVLATTAAEIWFWHNTIRAPPDVVSGYSKWTNFAWRLSVWQDEIQEKLNNYTNSVLQSGISTRSGIYSLLQNGTFLQQIPANSALSLQVSMEKVLKLKLLATILRAQDCFILRGSEPCEAQGPKNTLSEMGVLSYCGKDRVMMKIVKAKGTKTKTKIFGASLIQNKYGFSTAFLVESAWKCQQKYGKYDYNPYENSPLPTDINADCLFNLPVCDCSQKELIINDSLRGFVSRHFGKKSGGCKNDKGLHPSWGPGTRDNKVHANK
ncbi:hypothetical protein O181_019031 [Austropuccinia psidii MF-1]|uniref:DUF7872 domain-containing protein n=1 Tax=Austropuccinia psidii MF-1 TaxID=1389203 RepID=A0A9Q3CAQ2_9BASI|nr:hypothetical protein [Austropuccinia psidii MF-1]